MDFDQIKQYWDGRASSDSSAQSTTQDFFLRDIEFNVLREILSNVGASSVLDVGCGDARTTARLASVFTDSCFVGCDYAESMVKNSRATVSEAGISNLSIECGDVTSSLPVGTFDGVYTTRCLINLPQLELQQKALRNIADKVTTGGHYVMIENFQEGQDNFNAVRQSFGLPEIPVRDHNLFFSRDWVIATMKNQFELVKEENISSNYYLVSRVLYSMICQDKGCVPDYFDVHHKYAAQLPFAGEYGPVRMMLFKKR